MSPADKNKKEQDADSWLDTFYAIATVSAVIATLCFLAAGLLVN